MTTPLAGERALDRLLAGLQPVLDPESYAFCRHPDGPAPAGPEVLGRFREAEGVTLILPRRQALAAGLTPDLVARRIELRVHSDLQAVGFLARITAVLASASIPCNVVSAAYHDHLFVPEDRAEAALALLLRLEARSARAAEEVIYAVTIRIEAAAAVEWLGWMQEVHVPAVLNTGCFSACRIDRAVPDGPAQEHETFVLEYHALSLDRLEQYQRDHAPALQQEHSLRYAGKFQASRAIRRIVRHLYPAS